MEEYKEINIPETLTYENLQSLSNALSTAVDGRFMSPEEAKFIWGRHMVKAGWKILKTKTVETKVVPKKVKGVK